MEKDCTMIRLEKFGREDFSQLIEWIYDEEIMINWSGSLFSFPLTVRSLNWYIKGTDNPSTADALAWKIVDDTTGNSIGHISLGGISRKNRSARISRVLIGDRAMRGKGICRIITNAVLKIGFEDMQLHRISLGVYAFNKSAITCYEKCGFTTEGISRDILLHKGEYWSLVEMSILENEYRSLNK